MYRILKTFLEQCAFDRFVLCESTIPLALVLKTSSLSFIDKRLSYRKPKQPKVHIKAFLSHAVVSTTEHHQVHKNGISADFKLAFLSLFGLSFRILS